MLKLGKFLLSSKFLIKIVNGYTLHNHFFKLNFERVKKLKDKMKKFTPKCIVCGQKKGFSTRCKGKFPNEDFGAEANTETRCNNWYHPICGYLAGFHNKVEIINDNDSTISENFCKYKFYSYCPTCSLDKCQSNMPLQTNSESNQNLDLLPNTVSFLYKSLEKHNKTSFLAEVCDQF